jgi:hypothetical protein
MGERGKKELEGREGNRYPQSHPQLKMALELRMALRVQDSMKSLLKFLPDAFRHPVEVSPDQASSNSALKRTSSGKATGKYGRSLSRLPFNFECWH